VAIKLLNTPEENANQTKNSSKLAEIYSEVRREIWLMSGLVHENIIQLKGICQQPVCIIMELAPVGDLYNFIHSNPAPDSSSGIVNNLIDCKLTLTIRFLGAMHLSSRHMLWNGFLA
jgi:serine/threonine protein kinase